MSQKMKCPVCNSYTSSVLSRVMDGDPCPYCGTSAEIVLRVEGLRESHKESGLRDEVERLTVALGKAEARAVEAEAMLVGVRDILLQAAEITS